MRTLRDIMSSLVCCHSRKQCASGILHLPHPLLAKEGRKGRSGQANSRLDGAAGMTNSVLSLVVLLSAVFLLPVSSSLAGEPTDQVKNTVDEVIAIINNRELKKPEKKEARRVKIRETIEKRFDFEEMAKRSLALHWKGQKPEDQKEFVRLFSDLLEDTYINKIERFEDEKVVYTDERSDGQYATVKTRVVTTKEVEIPVDYRIFKKGNKWEVYDIIIEGVSLVNNYRTQFNQIIRSSSYEDLVKRLKKKTLK